MDFDEGPVVPQDWHTTPKLSAQDYERPLFSHARPLTLPFEGLTAPEFEKLILMLARRVGAVDYAQRYGVSGQAQAGIDIFCRMRTPARDGRCYRTIQCRNVADVTGGDIVASAKVFLRGTWAAQSAIFTFATRVPATRVERADAIEEAAALLRSAGIVFEVWDGEYLSELLYEQPVIVDRFFGTEARQRFCGTASLSRAPWTLPSPPAIVAGRANQLAALNTAVRRGLSTVFITGEAGVGKTALIVHFAAHAESRFPDGLIYLDLKGFAAQPPISVSNACDELLESLAPLEQSKPSNLSSRLRELHELLRIRRVLILLDNVSDTEQVRPLLSGGGASTVIITSRRRLGIAVHEAGSVISMTRLHDEEARDLLRQVLGPERLDAEPAAVERIVAFCAGLPLALRIFAACAAGRDKVSLAEIADDLDDPGSRDLAFEHEGTDGSLWAVISWSYRVLDPSAAQTFGLLGCLPESELSQGLIARLLENERSARDLRTLTDLHLLDEVGKRLFRMHSILRAFAAGVVEPADSQKTFRSFLDILLVDAVTADIRISPERSSIRHRVGLPERSADHTIMDLETARSWFARHKGLLIACLPQGLNDGAYDHVWKLVSAMTPYLWRQGELETARELLDTALQAARAAGDLNAQAIIWRLLASTSQRLDDHDVARDQAKMAVQVSEELNEPLDLGHSRYILAVGYADAGFHREAVPEYREAAVCFQSSNDPKWLAFVLNGLADSLLEVGEHGEAHNAVMAALAEQRGAFQDRNNEAATLRTLARIQSRTGDIRAAAETFVRAADIYQELEYPERRACAYEELAAEHSHHGDVASAHLVALTCADLYNEAARPEKAAEVLARYPATGIKG
jgi:tetratricopeptide (TPR) repeat protein